MKFGRFGASRDLIVLYKNSLSLSFIVKSSNWLFISKLFLEAYMCQFWNLLLNALNHSLIPDSPLLISCPCPTKQIITAQSRRITYYPIVHTH